MNKIANKFLLIGDNFFPELYLKKPGFTYSACEPFFDELRQIKQNI